MNPVQVADELRDAYISYLLTSFAISESANRINDRFRELLSVPGRLIAGPYLEATPAYERSPHTLSELTGPGQLLNERFGSLYRPAEVKPAKAIGFGKSTTANATEREPRLRPDRRLYTHQFAALERLCRAADQETPHTVVSSGTGSGKTECFLLPAIDWVFRHPTRSIQGRNLVPNAGLGLRVLLVYPMNALVNDQIRRLRSLVGYRGSRDETPVPITFARYTSETKLSEKEARNAEPNAPDNQLISRERILENPPDILITNFAMLEQSLLRPKETPFFESIDAHAWRFLILDEAHSYRGAQGIELARLMQRVRSAVYRGQSAQRLPLRDTICIATSATLTDAKTSIDEARQVTAKFAGDLFGVTVETESGVIFARRTDPLVAADIDGANAPPDDAWPGESLQQALRELSGPVDNGFRQALSPVLGQLAHTEIDKRAYLHAGLKRLPRVHWLWEKVCDKPRRFDELAEAWRAEHGWSESDAEAALANLVTACNAARIGSDEQSLLPCRYHLFASALEGLFVDLASDIEMRDPCEQWSVPELGIRQLELRRKHSTNRRGLEISRCLGCGFPFVVDVIADVPGVDSPPVWERPANFFSLTECSMPNGNILMKREIDLRAELTAKPIPRHLYEVPRKANGTDVQQCPHCGRSSAHHDVAARFLTGQDAPVSILTNVLYEQLPGQSEVQLKQLREQYAHRFMSQEADPQIGQGRKLLMFSDSRQNAAFMASYVQERSVESIVRQLAWRALPTDGRSIPFSEWADETQRHMDRHGYKTPYVRSREFDDEREPFQGGFESGNSKKRQAILAMLLKELTGTGPVTLESLGLLRVEYGLERLPGQDGELEDKVAYDNWPGPPLEWRDIHDLVDRTLRMMRRRNSILGIPTEGIDPPGFGNVVNWLAQTTGSNELPENCHYLYGDGKLRTQYSDLAQRWSRARKAEADDDVVRMLLADLFNLLTQCSDVVEIEKGSLAIKPLALRVARPQKLWLCDKCGEFTHSQLAGVCSSWRCRGQVNMIVESELPTERRGDLFVDRVVSESLRGEIRAEEHTAQLSSDYGQQVQEALQCGQVSVLSCSTTFEMGIDIGDLQALVLRNAPPGPVNYLQRAGRAGRRADTVAFVLTYCQRRPHDRHHFADPLRLIAGTVRPPTLDLTNPKILARHCDAEVMAEYWSWLSKRKISGMDKNPFDGGGRVGAFFDSKIDGIAVTPVTYLRTWLTEAGREPCRSRLMKGFTLNRDEADAHLDRLADLSNMTKNPIARAKKETDELLDAYRKSEVEHQSLCDRAREEERVAKTRQNDADAGKSAKEADREYKLTRTFTHLIRQLKDEYLPSYLMSRGVLPSFAFPVNVAQLHVLRDEMSEKPRNQFKLERDGKIGLSDYSPGSEVVAGKWVFQSVGLRKYPALKFSEIEWYRFCAECGHMEDFGRDRPSGLDPDCPICAKALVPPRAWVRPTWGYVTDRSAKPKRPAGRRPDKGQSTRAFFRKQLIDGAPHVLPSPSEPVRVEAIYAAGRSLLVLNQGHLEHVKSGWRRAGFLICERCGRSKFEGKDTFGKHRAPYHEMGRACQGDHISRDPKASGQEPVSLGHPYETDVVRLDFLGTQHSATDTGFWLSLAYALVNGATAELGIERTDVDAVCDPLADGNRQAIVLFDTVPGGAGHCREVTHHLPEIISRARDLLAGCECDPDSVGCYGCLSTYSNQFAHHLLSRGGALDFLVRLADTLESGRASPWRTVASPTRELLQSLRSATGTVAITTQAIHAGQVAGLNREWLDVLHELALRPVGPEALKIVLNDAPRLDGSSAESHLFHQLASLQKMGVNVEQMNVASEWNAILIDAGGQMPTAWRWPWAHGGMSPELTSLECSRTGRFEEARADLPLIEGRPLHLDLLSEFHHFTLEARQTKNPFADAYLGRFRDFVTHRLLIIDPHILRSQANATALEKFLHQVKFADHSEVRIKAARPREARERSRNDVDAGKQDQLINNLRSSLSKRGVELLVDRPTRVMEEHDRVLLWHGRESGQDRHYRVLLGQGLISFELSCQRRSEGVYFRVGAGEFEAEWN